MATISETISCVFRETFEAHPSRHSDPALALESARETASEAVPAGVTGQFDDETLTFTADADSQEEPPLSDLLERGGRALERELGRHGMQRFIRAIVTSGESAVHEEWNALTMDEVLARLRGH